MALIVMIGLVMWVKVIVVVVMWIEIMMVIMAVVRKIT